VYGCATEKLKMDKVERCDVCGAELDKEDVPIHLCKICQGIVL